MNMELYKAIANKLGIEFTYEITQYGIQVCLKKGEKESGGLITLKDNIKDIDAFVRRLFEKVL